MQALMTRKQFFSSYPQQMRLCTIAWKVIHRLAKRMDEVPTCSMTLPLQLLRHSLERPVSTVYVYVHVFQIGLRYEYE